MTRYQGLHVGAVQIDRMRDGYPDELLVVFQDSMRRTDNVEALQYDEYWEDNETITVIEYAAQGSVIANRLDILGFTKKIALDLLDKAISEARESKRRLFESISGENDTTGELDDHFEAEMAYLEGYTSERWVEDIRRAAEREDRDDIWMVGNLRWLLDIAGYDPRAVLRVALLAWPDAEVRLDATVDDNAGRPESSETACSEALDALRMVGAEHAPIVVLTEGKTDVRVLESAMLLLYPHLTDLVRFMDYGQRPMGGAGALVTMVRAFSAAGIANKIVALFDSDTAASDALRNLSLGSLTDNIRVLQYPRLDLAEKYPTLGPPSDQFPSGRLDVADINGLACSIELYLGRDVLASPSGDYRPVQWHSYVSGMRRYQGEIIDKGSLMDAYNAKLKAAQANPAVVASQDWSGIEAIIRLVINAFDVES